MTVQMKLGDTQPLASTCEFCGAALHEKLIVHPDGFGDRTMLIWSDPVHEGLDSTSLVPPFACIAYLAAKVKKLEAI